MRARLKHLELDPDPATLPADPAGFALLARMIVGPTDGPGEESFDVTVCTPEWLADACRKSSGIYDPRHHLLVDFDGFDQRTLHNCLASRVSSIEANTWPEVGELLRRKTRVMLMPSGWSSIASSCSVTTLTSGWA